MTVSDEEKVKADVPKFNYTRIMEMLDANDIDRLREMVCTSDGLIDSSIRERAWPLFINCDQSISATLSDEKFQDLKQHKDADQVLKDVERSFIYLNDDCNKTMIGNTYEDLDFLRKRLNKLILRVLIAIPGINYYQGYHDVASMVVLKFHNDKDAFQFLYTLTLRFLRDHMMNGIDPTMKQLNLIPEILSLIDYDLYQIIKPLNPVYALSSIISLFTHDIINLYDSSVIWDFLLARDDPQLVIYIYVALMVYYKDDILVDLNEMSDSSIGSKDIQYDIDILHVVLNNFIRTHLNVNSLDSKLEVYNVLKLAIDIQHKAPLSRLKSFKKISVFSFLKSKSTSVTILNLQIEEYKKYESRMHKEKYILKKLNGTALIKRKIHQAPIVFKLSLGVGILGIILHTTYKQPGNRLIEGHLTQRFSLLWEHLLDSLK